MLIINYSSYFEVNLYSILLFVSLAYCGKEELSHFALNTKLIDEGWVDHSDVGAGVDQAVSGCISSIVGDDLEGHDLQVNLRGFGQGCSSARARGSILVAWQDSRHGWDDCDFSVVSVMISVFSGWT